MFVKLASEKMHDDLAQDKRCAHGYVVVNTDEILEQHENRGVRNGVLCTRNAGVRGCAAAE